VTHRRRIDLIVLAAYVAWSFAYFGWGLLPHPGRVVGGNGHDAEIFIWSFAWWPHALTTWTNPFVSHVIYGSYGINLAWVTSVPGLALLFSPVTALFGPTVAYNVAWLLLPSLAAWTGYLLSRAVTESVYASLVGGFLFGFSSYVIGQQPPGHLNLTAVFLLPLVALVLYRHVSGDLSARGLVWRLGILLTAQFAISTEVTATLTVAIVLALGIGLVMLPDLRPRLLRALVPIGGAYLLTAVLAAPFIVYLLTGFVRGTFLSRAFSEPYGSPFGADVANLVIPSRMAAIGGPSLASVSAHLGTNDERGMYLGVPILVMIAALAYRDRRSLAVRYLLVLLGAAIVLASGDALYVYGNRLFPLPWELVKHAPGLNNVEPVRCAVYVSLAASVLVAIWIGGTAGRVYRRPFVLPALAIVALLPPFWQSVYPRFRPAAPERVAFFRDGIYRSCLSPGETVAVLKNSDPVLWQAEAAFRFKLAADGLQAIAPGVTVANRFDADPLTHATFASGDARPTTDTIRAFAAANDVARFVWIPDTGYPSTSQMRRIGPIQVVGGVHVSPACGYPPLSRPNLNRYLASYRANEGANIGYCVGASLTTLPYGLEPAGGLAGARRAIFVAGRGLTCPPAPPGFKRHGFASETLGVPARTYPFYSS
jgi:hypothetical protein